MFENRKDIDLVFQNCLDAVHKKCCTQISTMRGAGENLTLFKINSTLNEVWAEHFEHSGYATLIQMAPEEQKKALNEAKNQILSSLLQYLPVQTAKTFKPERTINWVTEEVRNSRYYWKLCRQWMERQYSEPVADSIDEESELVLRALHNPKDNKPWSSRGLVMGQIQRGKTANYCGLVCKAADAGYKLIIILSGIHNDLRCQTQQRLDEAFVGYSNRSEGVNLFKSICGVGTLAGYDENKAPNCATTLDDDFKDTTIVAEEKPWLFVVKKNTSVFKKLIRWLKNSVPDKNKWPLLLIDDEADLASINTHTKEDLATATNKVIREMLQLFPRSCFVGYTATPFANVLINANAETEELGKDLFPKDFIIRLSSPTNYFGPEAFFGNISEDGLDLYDTLPQEQADVWMKKIKNKQSSAESVPEAAQDAVLQFILASALRLWRNKQRYQEETEERKPYSSMLIHVSYLVNEQDYAAAQIKNLFHKIALDPMTGSVGLNEKFAKRLNTLFIRQKSVITPDIQEKRKSVDTYSDWSLPETFEDLSEEINQVLRDLQIEEVNGRTEQRVIHRPISEEDERKICASIFIGGNKLSRGLTLPGLCVSVFVRTTSMYDTLMQMGRWFGYRDGYIDLCRLITTPNIIDKFRLISEAVEDFSAQIDDLNQSNLTPTQVRLRILSHPGLMVTARNKMRSAERFAAGFNGLTAYKLIFDLDAERIDQNWLAAKELYSQANAQGKLVYNSALEHNELESPDPKNANGQGGRAIGRLWRDVPSSAVADFLDHYSALKNNDDKAEDSLANYIREMSNKGLLNRWTLWIPGEPKDDGDLTEKQLGCTPISRNNTEKGAANGHFDDYQVTLKTIKGGGSERFGVPVHIWETAVNEPHSKRSLFRKLKQVAGRESLGVSDQGYMQLIPFTVDRLKDKELTYKAIRRSNGDLPLISYFLWMPENEKASKLNWAYFNTSIIDESEDEILSEDEE